ncbi:MAG TPA: hypothetical protein DEA82_13965 [Flavobacteriaceae bacterium]|jgi:hypothetical protein|nr:hypothetical protein [Flavobacteriaceae bacterium]MAM30605.1 hypothetical protein [Flavobacteriaceae bacterium]MAY52142.1 hypothetical protein [Flavobacteriaceae bacterium]HBR55222.1 hypothetical protein [Flavobacteriaceae bacterium]HIB47162.1 hypothetical protein [Flavobacteriaceae bacterium]|tara:strand:+ start:2270 stop:2509 length:240 start_codon:yes stop_codon:yes gene_type:complete
MKQEISQIAQLFFQLKKKYELSQCSNCLVMRDYILSEYKHLKLKLQSLERLCASADLDNESSLAEAHRTAGVLGLYLMV